MHHNVVKNQSVSPQENALKLVCTNTLDYLFSFLLYFTVVYELITVNKRVNTFWHQQ